MALGPAWPGRQDERVALVLRVPTWPRRLQALPGGPVSRVPPASPPQWAASPVSLAWRDVPEMPLAQQVQPVSPVPWVAPWAGLLQQAAKRR